MTEKITKTDSNEMLLKTIVTNLTAHLEPLAAEGLRSNLSAFITSPQSLGVEAVPLAMIYPGNGTSRLACSDAELQALSGVIRRRGFNGILVGRRRGTLVEVAFGGRRVRAAALAGLETVPVQIRDLSDQEMFELALEENFHFTRLSPLEEGLLFKRMLEESAYTLEMAAALSGRSSQDISDLLLIVQHPEIVEALREDQIKPETALELAKVEDRVIRKKMLHQALALKSHESVSAHFIVTTVRVEGPEVTSVEPVSSDGTPVNHPASSLNLANGSGSKPPSVARKRLNPPPEEQYAAVEELLSAFKLELKSQNLAALRHHDGWRKKTRKLLKKLRAELNSSIKLLKKPD